jgi:hypothetical protein
LRRASRVVDARALEERLDEYLGDAGSMLLITGPSKCGKTVLLRHNLPPGSSAVYVHGGRITCADDVWAAISTSLNVWTEEREAVAREESASARKSWKASAKTWLLGGELAGSRSAGTAGKDSWERARSKALPEAAAETLMRHRLPLVIDDFHHLPRDAQEGVIAGLKDLVFDGPPASHTRCSTASTRRRCPERA